MQLLPENILKTSVSISMISYISYLLSSMLYLQLQSKYTMRGFIDMLPEQISLFGRLDLGYQTIWRKLSYWLYASTAPTSSSEVKYEAEFICDPFRSLEQTCTYSCDLVISHKTQERTRAPKDVTCHTQCHYARNTFRTQEFSAFPVSWDLLPRNGRSCGFLYLIDAAHLYSTWLLQRSRAESKRQAY